MNSVCIASYNGEKYIEEQLRSILQQLCPDDEVVISDDGSTDRTIEIIESIGDKRIRIVHNDCHNVRKNFENALREARGEVIFLSDQDDVWLPGKYARCIEELKKVDLVCTNSILTDEHLNVICNDFFKQYHSKKGVIRNIINGTYYGSCMAFRRTLLSSALPIPSSKDMNHDLWIGLVAEMTGSVKFISEPYLLYRRHMNTVSLTRDYSDCRFYNRSSRPLWVKIRTRIIVSYYVCKFRILHKYARKLSKRYNACL